MKIDTASWGEFRIDELFDVVYGVNLELVNCTETSIEDPEAIAFVSRTESNNGISGYVKPVLGVEPQPKDTITVAGGGSVLATFLQPRPFYSGRDLYVLYPKEPISKQAKLFIATVIKANKYRYNYGRQANVTLPLLRLKLPVDLDGKPDWHWMESYIDSLHSKLLTTKNFVKPGPPDTSGWKDFAIGKIFRLESGKVSNASELIDGEDIPYIGAKKSDNGIMRYVELDESKVTKGHCVVFICDGQGSIGLANYMNVDFIGTVNIVAGYNDALTLPSGLFIATVFSLERKKYSFGRKLKKSLPFITIKLPATSDGEPDWQWMENYIKSLPYGDRLPVDE